MIIPINNRNFLFIHIPRTGGAYLEDRLSEILGLRKEWPIPDTNLLYGIYQNSPTHFFTLNHLTFQEANQHFIDRKAIHESFSIVRNPYDRAVSLYHYWGGNENFDFESFLDLLVSFDLNNYAHNGFTATSPNLDYLGVVDHMRTCQYHFIPQSAYVCNSSGAIEVDLIRYGNYDYLNTYLGISSLGSWAGTTLAAKFKSKYLDAVMRALRLNVVLWDKQRAEYTRKRNMAFLDSRRLSRIRQIYQKDFALLEYPYGYDLDSPF